MWSVHESAAALRRDTHLKELEHCFLPWSFACPKTNAANGSFIMKRNYSQNPKSAKKSNNLRRTHFCFWFLHRLLHARQLSLIPQLLRSSFCYCCSCCSLYHHQCCCDVRESCKYCWVQSSQLAHHSSATPSHLAETGVILQPQLGLGLGIRARRWVTRVLKRQRASSSFLSSWLITQRRGFVQWKLEAATMSKRGTHSHPIHDDGTIFFEEIFWRFLRGNFFHQFSEHVVDLLVLFMVSWRWTASSYVRRS